MSTSAARHVDPAAALALIEQHEARARDELQAASGGAPLCGSDGRPRPVKGLEGAAVALADVRRAVRGQRADGARDVLEGVASVRATWQAILDAEPRGPGWRVYAEGGLRALDALDTDLAALASGSDPHDTARPLEGAGLSSLFTPPPVGPTATSAPAGRPADAAGPVLAHGWRAALVRRWPARRVAAAVGLLTLALVALAGGAGWPVPAAGWWTASTFGAALFAALTLATFVPARGSGQLLDLGCTPCATMAGVVSVGAIWYLATTPVDPGTGLLALAGTGFALVKRLTDPEVCVR